MKAKRNLFVSLITLMLLLCCSMLFVACDIGDNDPNDNNDLNSNTNDDHIHTYAEARTAPTCEQPGSIFYECTCGASYSEPIPELGHNYGDLVAEKPATYTDNGYHAYYQCDVCNTYFDSSKNKTTWADLVIGALSHDYGELITAQSATCTDDGYKAYYYCEECETYFDENKVATPWAELVIGALGHNSNGIVNHKDADCTNAGVVGGVYCTRCNNGKAAAEATIDALEHDNKGSITHKDADCTNAGVVGGVYCTRCNNGKAAAEATIKALGHDASGTACSRCNIEVATELAYVLSEDNSYYIVSGIGSEMRTSFIIPSTYNGLPVKEIGEKAFMNCKYIIEIWLPSGITKIGDSAFWNCESLVRINIPNGVTSIGELAFLWTNLEELILPSSIESIGEAAFAAMQSLKSIVLDGENEYYRVVGNCLIDIKTKTLLRGTESSVIPIDGSVTAIGKNAFNYCYGLEAIVIPEGITTIGDDAFSNCSRLKSITLPNSLTSIGEQAFLSCNFTEVVIGEAVINVGVRAFSSCYKLKTVTLPVSLTYIDYQTFESCYALEKIIFTGTGEQWHAVYKASNWDYGAGDYEVECLKATQEDILTFTLSEDKSYYIVSGIGDRPAASFVIPSTYNGLPVKAIGEKAFYECATIEKIIIPDSVTDIGGYAFYGCISLTDIRISGAVISIGEYAFYGCSLLTDIKILNGVEKIGEYAFANCASLEGITIPGSVATIGGYAFYGCGILSNVTISSGVAELGEYAFAGCTAITNLTIPSSVTTIGANAFNGCTALTVVDLKLDIESMSSSLAELGEYAFAGCTSLESIAIPNKVKTIGANAFNGCIALKAVYIYNGATVSIGEYAFAGCIAITSIDFPEGVTSIGAHTFDGCTNLASITLPSSLTNIGGYAFRGCTALTSIDIPSDVTSIGDYTFYGCTNLASITLKESITSIGKYAFYKCSALASITLPERVNNIGTYAFYECVALTSINIPDGVETINDYVFYGCTSLSEVSLWYYSSLKYIRSYAFRGCTSLKSIDLPTRLKQIYGHAFYKSGLESVVLRSSLDSVGKYAFAHCTSLTQITFSTRSDNLDVRAYAFKGCTALTDLTVRKANIGVGVFKECTGLKNVTINSSVKSIQSDAFLGCTSIESMTLPYIGYSSSSVASKYCYLGYLFGAEKYSENADYIPSSLKSIKLTGDSAGLSKNTFYGCTGIASVTVTDGVTSLPKGVFRHLTSLESISLAFVGGSASATEASSNTLFGYIFGDSLVDRAKTTAVTQYYGYGYHFDWKEATYYIPNSLKSVTINGSTLFGAFSNCTGLTSITFGENAKSIGEHTFYGCSGITQVHMTDIGKWCQIEFYANDINYSPIFKKSVSLYYKGSVVTDLEIPEGVTKINDYAFYNRTSISSVTVPSSLKAVGKSAFSGCSGITKVNAGDINRWCEIDFATPKANPLNGGASLYCNGSLVTELTLSDEATSIGSYAFYGYTALKSATIPSSLKTVGDSAFYNSGITNVYITDLEKWSAIDFVSSGANPLSNGALLYCNGSLVTELTLSDGATSIGRYAFYDYTALKRVTIPSSLKAIGDSAFYGTSLSGVYINDLKAWCGISGLSTFGTYTLYLNNAPISGKLVIPDGVTSISDYAFYNNAGITSIELPDGLLSIGSYAFGNCTGIESVVFPSGFTSIGSNAFSNCTGIKSVDLPDGLSEIGSYAFRGCSALAGISIPDGASIGEYSFIECDALVKVSSPYSLIYNFYAVVELTITSGNYDEYESSQRGMLSKLTTLIIGDNVTSLGGFEQQFTTVKTLYVGSGVTNIDHGISSNRSMTVSVSENNNSYKTVDGVLYTKDGKKLLYYPANKTATSFTVPSGVEDIGYYAFAYNNHLKNVTLPDTVKTIGDYAFHECTGLTNVELGQGVTTIGTEAFYKCTGLTSITIPASVTLIKSYAFYGCENLKTMTMEASDVWEDPYIWYMTDSSDKTGGTPIGMVGADSTVSYFTGFPAKANYYRI